MVTGANTGIGQGIALSIGRAGGRVIGVGRSSMAQTAGLLAEIGAPLHRGAGRSWIGHCGAGHVRRGLG